MGPPGMEEVNPVDVRGYVGNASNNTNITGNGTVSTASDYLYVDLFGWVGASSSWTDAAKYGISKSTATNAENGYGTSATEALKSDWGNVDGISSGWRTLTSAEWGYIFTERTTGGTVFGTSQARYAHATIHEAKYLDIIEFIDFLRIAADHAHCLFLTLRHSGGSHLDTVYVQVVKQHTGDDELLVWQEAHAIGLFSVAQCRVHDLDERLQTGVMSYLLCCSHCFVFS